MNPIKRARLKASCTQAEAAKVAKVSQSTYHRWENESLSPSAEKLALLAKHFGTTVSALKGEAASFDRIGFMGLAEDQTHFGEVAAHFKGSGEPLLLSITIAECKRALKQMQSESAFLTIMSMDNQSVFIRREAIADIYFSSEALQVEGPEGDRYQATLGKDYPQEFWEKVDTYIQTGGFAHVPEADKAFRALLEPSDADYAEAVREGRLKAEDRDFMLACDHAHSARLCGLATKMYWQMGAMRREALLDEESDVLSLFMLLDGAPLVEVMGTPVCVAVEQQHQIIYINPTALDYISIPTHKYEAQNLQMLDEMDV